MRIAGLDLLRGVAIGLVMLRHAFPSLFAGAGVVGVVMFFALSGFLITGVLLGELEREHRVDLGRFYRRRARRLVPALLLLVAGVVAVTLLLDPLGDRDQLGKTVLVALTWTGNLPFGHASDATFHLWTLATEEQFYLVWPAVLALAFARRRVGVALAVTAAACLLACVLTLLWLAESPDLAYALPTSWAVCFVIGAATRVYADRLVLPGWSVPVALAGLALLSVVPLRGHALTYLAGGPAIAVLTAVLLVSWRTWTTVSGPALTALVWLGTVSYAAYLWNYPLTLWLRPHLDLAGPVAAVLTLAMAAVSWYAVERPWQERRLPAVVAAT
ncbi:acyltransferase [Nocardioides szechwanensis]|uniref:Peptidoglycan/LPS O-acetylase OafA/YrhL, contains acyltransferase and SGNH-hydrolase domains n=1 Tax=Nocardioides szechwanensis TaxID=1005944 RepID=A0A1H0L147_9ACTN|nr:acyltransferase [Nocardioides szechwanensis]GEP35582.1 acyltransferase [Nocardioides szechwanensis]SDO62014.1 Peptidoglycan/LPS O-acetylase OafA/YrhL, contains acyltransferase and SGNH-hydrolase domains [Nocardioides szechwanensis]